MLDAEVNKIATTEDPVVDLSVKDGDPLGRRKREGLGVSEYDQVRESEPRS
jgi:hypothetical protein